MRVDGLSGGRGGRRGDAGAGALEYIGVLAGVAVLVAAVAVVPVAAPARDGVVRAICLFLGGQDCGGTVEANDLPKCETSFDSRALGVNATVFSVKLGRGDEYRISRYGDGSARVSTSDTSELGLSGGLGGNANLDIGDDGAIGGGAGLKGSATVTGGLRAIYDFDSVAEADAWVDSNRNGFTQTLNFLGGPLADGAEQLANYFDGDRPTPSAFAVEVSQRLKGSAEAGFGGLVQGSGEVSGTATGVYEYSLRDGSSSFTGTMSGSLGAQGTLLFGQGSGSGSEAIGYTVKYDAEGEPVALTMTRTSTRESAIGMNTTPLGTGSDTIKDVGWDFTIADKSGLETTTLTLDLGVPANRAAFDDTFLSVGQVAAPRPDAVFDGGAESLGARFAADGLAVRTTYAMDKGGGGLDLAAGAGLKFGFGGSVDTLNRQLLSAMAYDARDPGAGAFSLTTCE